MQEKERKEVEFELRNQFCQLKLIQKEHQIEYIKKSRDLNKKAVDRLLECSAFDTIIKKAFEAREPPSENNYIIIKLAQFLWIYENIYTECINDLCFLFTCNGHDLLNQYCNEYAVSVEQIENVSISAKLKFLEQHKIRIFNRKVDRDLRNTIAHQHYIIENEKIKLKDKKIDIHKSCQELINFATEFSNLYTECFNKYYRNLDDNRKDAKP